MSLDWGEGLPGAVEGCHETTHSTGAFRGPPAWEPHGQEAQEEAGTQDKDRGKDRAFGQAQPPVTATLVSEDLHWPRLLQVF